MSAISAYSICVVHSSVLVCAADSDNRAITQKCTETQNELNRLKKENSSHIRRAKYLYSATYERIFPKNSAI